MLRDFDLLYGVVALSVIGCGSPSDSPPSSRDGGVADAIADANADAKPGDSAAQATPDGGPWTCGTAVCTGVQWCWTVVNASGMTGQTSYSCEPPPSSCSSPSIPNCACVTGALMQSEPFYPTTCVNNGGQVMATTNEANSMR